VILQLPRLFLPREESLAQTTLRRALVDRNGYCLRFLFEVFDQLEFAYGWLAAILTNLTEFMELAQLILLLFIQI
jgi:hypothetical protein